jgi:Sec-independent protein translocase protein TatA
VDFLALLIVLLILAVIWRGPKTLPQIGSMLGRGVREARNEADRLRAERDASTAASAASAEPGDRSDPTP